MDFQNHGNELAAAAKLTPTITVSGLTLGGVGLADWVLVLTALYTVLQILFLLRDRLGKRNGSKRRDSQ